MIMKEQNKKAVVIDIIHYPHINFYKNAIKIITEKSIDLHVILRPRGKLISIFRKECPDIPFILVGDHRKTILGKIFDMIERDIIFINYLRKINFDAGTAVGGVNITHASKFLAKPSIIFTDDLEYKLQYYLYSPIATHIILPKSIPADGERFLKYNGFKELAYLHPNHFSPDKKALRTYNLNPYEYIFIREVSNKSLNYRKTKMGQLSKILDHIKEKKLKILISIEDKSLIDLFKDHCIILKEPIEDIYSLMSYALFAVSSGDSMARESCLVGTPAIYTGGRDMAVNNELIKRSCMFKVEDEKEIKKTIDYIIENNIKEEVQNKINQAIRTEWVDTTEVIIDVLMGMLYKDNSLIDKYRY